MTETRPAPDEVAVAAPAHVEASGLAGWLSTSDHKRIGRLWIATSLLHLLVAVVLGLLLAVERLNSGADLLTGGTYAQVFTLRSEALALLFVAPFFLGLATYVVPLQVGATSIAFPRGSATAYWGYLVGSLLVLAAYVADGGITGTTPTSVDLYFLSLMLVAASLCVGAVSAVTTVLALRAPGMSLRSAPLFSWSVLIGGGLLLLQLPVLAARALGLFIPFHTAGDVGSYEAISWVWRLPAVYGLVVMAAGVLLEVVPTVARHRIRFQLAGVVVLGLLGTLGIGGWLLDPAAVDDLLYVAMGVAVVVPALALLGVLADTARAGSPRALASLVMALAAALLLLAGAGAGALQVIEPLELAGTAWETGQLQLVLLGTGVLAALAALWHWAPKIWGAALSEPAGFLAALVVTGGVALAGVADLVVGAADDLPRGALQFEETDLATATGFVGLAGAALVLAGVLVAVVAVLAAALRRGGTAPDDPWGATSLEWTTSSPPPPHNFDVPPVVEEVPTVPTSEGAP